MLIVYRVRTVHSLKHLLRGGECDPLDGRAALNVTGQSTGEGVSSLHLEKY